MSDMMKAYDESHPQRCGNCRFRSAANYCRRFPPQVVYLADVNEAQTCSPAIWETNWCGEWQPKEVTK